MNLCAPTRRPVAPSTTGTEASRRWGAFLRQASWFVAVGVSSTALNAALYLLLRQWWALLPANLTALALSTVASTEANRLLTFVGATATRSRLDTQSVLVFGFYAGYTTVTLWLLHLAVPAATPEVEAAAVTVASVFGGLGRFLLLRLWVFRAGKDTLYARARSRTCVGYGRLRSTTAGRRWTTCAVRATDADRYEPDVAPSPDRQSEPAS